MTSFIYLWTGALAIHSSSLVAVSYIIRSTGMILRNFLGIYDIIDCARDIGI